MSTPRDSKRMYPTSDGAAITPAALRLAKISEVAEAYGFDAEYVRRIVEERRVATVKIGKYRLIDLDSWEQMLVSGYTPAVPRD